MSLARKKYLVNATRIGWELASEPYNLTSIIGSQLDGNNSLVNSTVGID
jgi:hypothetical protein